MNNDADSCMGLVDDESTHTIKFNSTTPYATAMDCCNQLSGERKDRCVELVEQILDDDTQRLCCKTNAPLAAWEIASRLKEVDKVGLCKTLCTTGITDDIDKDNGFQQTCEKTYGKNICLQSSWTPKLSRSDCDSFCNKSKDTKSSAQINNALIKLLDSAKVDSKVDPNLEQLVNNWILKMSSFLNTSEECMGLIKQGVISSKDSSTKVYQLQSADIKDQVNYYLSIGEGLTCDKGDDAIGISKAQTDYRTYLSQIPITDDQINNIINFISRISGYTNDKYLSKLNDKDRNIYFQDVMKFLGIVPNIKQDKKTVVVSTDNDKNKFNYLWILIPILVFVVLFILVGIYIYLNNQN